MNKINRNLVAFYIAKRKIYEFFRFDSKVASLILSLFYLINVLFLLGINRKRMAFKIAGSLYRHTIIPRMRRFAIQILHKEIRGQGIKKVGKIFLKPHSGDRCETEIKRLKKSIIDSNKRLFDKRLIILAPTTKDEKGVMLIKFTAYFKLFTKIFNLDKLCEDYVLILEPSSSGYFDDDILFLMEYEYPIIIQTGEPTDFEFIESLKSNLIPVDVSANWWVDKNTFQPIINCKKDFDLILVSIWADVKRHYSLFEALKRSGKKLNVALVGKPWQRTKDDILELAKYYGVDKQITFFEGVSQAELNKLYNRSRAYMLLSKKEGFNKSIIEAMFADVPVFLLDGFNFGHKYDYINPNTGGYLDRYKIDEFLNNLNSQLSLPQLIPSKWVNKYMTNDLANKKIVEVLREIEKKEKIKINKNLLKKVNDPDLNYQNKSDWVMLEPIYKKLIKYLEHSSNS